VSQRKNGRNRPESHSTYELVVKLHEGKERVDQLGVDAIAAMAELKPDLFNDMLEKLLGLDGNNPHKGLTKHMLVTILVLAAGQFARLTELTDDNDAIRRFKPSDN